MPSHRYRGVLGRPLKPGEDPTNKLPALCRDLGINPRSPRNALLALAARYVRGFQLAKRTGKPGRKKGLQPAIDEATEEFGPLIGKLVEGAYRNALYELVERFRQTRKTPGGRRFTKRRIVEIISKTPPSEDLENPYFGIPPTTLLSWVTHSGPGQRQRQAKFDAAVAKLEAYRLPADFKA